MLQSGLVQVQFRYFPGGLVRGLACAGYLVNPVQTSAEPNDKEYDQNRKDLIM
jgi:hypothetical protein